MASSGASPFSLRPWPIGERKPKNIYEFITRVSNANGGFRNAPTEDELREQIQAQAQAGSSEDVDMEGSSMSEEETETEKSKNVWAAKQEAYSHLE